MKKKTTGLQICYAFKIFLATQLNYLVPAAITILLYNIFAEGEISVWRLVVLAVFPILLYGLRCSCKKFSTFFMTHLLVATCMGVLLCFHASYGVERMIFPLILCIYVGLSFHWKALPGGKYEEEVIPPAIELFFFLLCLLLQNRWGIPSQNPIFFYLSIGYLCAYFLYYYLDNYFSFVTVNRIGQVGFREKNLLTLGAGMATAYIALGSGLLVVCTNQTLAHKVSAVCKNAVLIFLRMLLSLIPKGEPMEAEMVEETAEEIERIEEEITAQSSIFWQILDALLEIAFYLLIIAFCCVFIWSVIRLIKIIFRSNQRKVVFRGYNQVQQTEEKLIPRSPLHKRRKFWVGFSVNSKIRHAYAKLIYSKRVQLGKQKQEGLMTMTVRECTEVLKTPENTEAWQTITEIYERARYSGEECSTEQLRTIKKAITMAEKTK